VQEVFRTPHMQDQKRSTPLDIIAKTLNLQNKEC
jgi:hypothetical protein